MTMKVTAQAMSANQAMVTGIAQAIVSIENMLKKQ